MNAAFTSAGSHTFKFAVTGKDTASSGYDLGFDKLELIPVPN